MTDLALSHPGRLRRRGGGYSPSVVFLMAILGAFGGYGLVAYSLVSAKPMLALGLALLPLLLWESTRLTASLVFLGLSLPAIGNLLGGEDGGLKASLSDLLLVFLGTAIVCRAAARRSASVVGALAPVAWPVVQYAACLFLLLLVHPSLGAVLQTGQRLELFVLPLVVGAFAVLRDRHTELLKAYIVAATLFAAVWHFNTFGLQHNPVGQMFGNAILLLVAVHQFRALMPCLLILVPGLFLTGSRGAIAATAIGLAVIALMQASKGHVLLARVLPVATIAVAAFALIPTGLQQRLTTFSADPRNTVAQTNGQYAILTRSAFAQDARQVAEAHPWIGIGVGNYRGGTSSAGIQDPHQVVLLQWAEGGYFFAASFLVLVVGTVLALVAIRRRPLATAAAAILIATVTHGLVDVYWVRGTPILSWLLVGMACALSSRGAQAKARS